YPALVTLALCGFFRGFSAPGFAPVVRRTSSPAQHPKGAATGGQDRDEDRPCDPRIDRRPVEHSSKTGARREWSPTKHRQHLPFRPITTTKPWARIARRVMKTSRVMLTLC